MRSCWLKLACPDFGLQSWVQNAERPPNWSTSVTESNGEYDSQYLSNLSRLFWSTLYLVQNLEITRWAQHVRVKKMNFSCVHSHQAVCILDRVLDLISGRYLSDFKGVRIVLAETARDCASGQSVFPTEFLYWDHRRFGFAARRRAVKIATQVPHTGKPSTVCRAFAWSYNAGDPHEIHLYTANSQPVQAPGVRVCVNVLSVGQLFASLVHIFMAFVCEQVLAAYAPCRSKARRPAWECSSKWGAVRRYPLGCLFDCGGQCVSDENHVIHLWILFVETYDQELKRSLLILRNF